MQQIASLGGFPIAGAGLLTLFALAAQHLVLRSAASRRRRRRAQQTSEREQVARDLEDNLLQAVQGLTLSLETTAGLLPVNEPARATALTLVTRAETMLAEAQSAIEDLRRLHGHAALVARIASSSTAISADAMPPTIIRVCGHPRCLVPAVQDELERHIDQLFASLSQLPASRTSVRLTYSRWKLVVAVHINLSSRTSLRPSRLDAIMIAAERAGAQFRLRNRLTSKLVFRFALPAQLVYLGGRRGPADCHTGL